MNKEEYKELTIEELESLEELMNSIDPKNKLFNEPKDLVKELKKKRIKKNLNSEK